ncbi:MOSC domain-containing protein [Paenibacillus sp. HJL G12]|uniref:MOSC domain-containing protein n=2 Tax=Paenibacillus dendrobii TaxID=2691084 RepID=A0A7X3IM67_9BACL|nr:MOSC domain-containing protein [Paenibacillus dendrobii]
MRAEATEPVRRIISVNVGKPITVDYQGKPLVTGIHKQPVEGPVFVGCTQMDGDGQADLKNHGGPDKAICVYPFEHYAYWEQQFGKKLDYAAFGENLTVMGFLENEVNIGDVYEIGEVVVQVSQPRFPCFKISSKHGIKEFPARVLDTGYSGFYLRVLQVGSLTGTSQVIKRESHPMQVSVASVLRQMALGRSQADPIELRRMLELDALASSVKDNFQAWLNEV